MILAVTPNGSVDVTLRLTGYRHDLEKDVDPVAETAGGKGHNMARFLAGLGHRVTATGFAGGCPGRRVEDLLQADGVIPAMVPVRGRTRQFTTIIDAGGTRRVSYHMRGPDVSVPETVALEGLVERLGTDADWAVLGGSLARGMPDDFYGRLIHRLGRTRTILDASGVALASGLTARPYGVKINRKEFASLLGPKAPRGQLAEALARYAPGTGVPRWWITDGAGGSVGWIEGRVYHMPVPAIHVRNTSGAGDAYLAGLLHGLANAVAPLEQMRWGAAMSAAVCEQLAPIVPDISRVLALFSTLSIEGGAVS